MHWLALSILLQIVCAVHVIRTRRNTAWLFLIMFFSVLGCLVYFVAELMPGMRGNRHVRTAQGAAMKKFDPERALRHARDQLDLADTVANRTALADALADLGRHSEAIEAYRTALSMTPLEDPRVETRLALSLFESGEAVEALSIIERLPENRGSADGDQLLLLKARILAELGRHADARALYEDLVTRVPGEEARCRYAALLLETGDRGRAREMLEEVESRAKRLDRQQRFAERDMYDWASRELKTLRG